MSHVHKYNKANNTKAAKLAAKTFAAIHSVELKAAKNKAPAPGATFHIASYINMAEAINHEEDAD